MILSRRDQRQRKRSASGADRAYWRQIADAGWLGMSVPETFGGLGLGWHAMAAVIEEAGRAQLPEPLVGAGVLGATLLTTITPLPDSLARHPATSGVRWDAEDGAGLARNRRAAGSRRGRGRVRRQRHPREGAYVLNGEKRHVIADAAVDGWLVTADSEAGTLLFYLAAGTPGVTVRPMRARTARPPAT